MGSRSRRRIRQEPSAATPAKPSTRAKDAKSAKSSEKSKPAKSSMIADAARAAKASKGSFAENRPPAPLRFERRTPRAERTAGGPARPSGPWGRLPITEITVAVGLLIVGIALAGGASPRSPRFLAGVGVCGIGVVELTVREHVAGYRSHTLLLAFLPVVGLQGAISLSGLPQTLQRLAVPLDFVVFAVLFQVWQSVYKRARTKEQQRI